TSDRYYLRRSNGTQSVVALMILFLQCEVLAGVAISTASLGVWLLASYAARYSNSPLTFSIRSARPILAHAPRARSQRCALAVPGLSRRASRTSVHPVENESAMN